MSSDNLIQIENHDQRVWLDASKFVYSEITLHIDEEDNSTYNYSCQNAQDRSTMIRSWCLKVSLSGSPELIRFEGFSSKEEAIRLEQAILEEVKRSYW